MCSSLTAKPHKDSAPHEFRTHDRGLPASALKHPTTLHLYLIWEINILYNTKEIFSFFNLKEQKEVSKGFEPSTSAYEMSIIPLSQANHTFKAISKQIYSYICLTYIYVLSIK